jgi:hypothetical protein
MGLQVRECRDVTVSGCLVQDHGNESFEVVRSRDVLFVDSVFRRANTKGFNRGWAASNKVVLTSGFTAERCVFEENHGNGLWFDIGNEACTVRNCLIRHNENAGLFYEISYGLHAHDNVIIGNGFGEVYGAWGMDGGISISSSVGCVIERNLLVGNKEGFQFREQQRTTPRIGREQEGEEAIWNRDHVVRDNVFAYNRDAQVWGWFAIDDSRHWPRGKGSADPQSDADPAAGGDLAAEYLARSEDGQPLGLRLDDLNLAFTGNVYARHPGSGLFNWGAGWAADSARFGSLTEVGEALGFGDWSREASVVFRDELAGDYRVVASEAEAARWQECLPRGSVPEVRTGVVAGD